MVNKKIAKKISALKHRKEQLENRIQLSNPNTSNHELKVAMKLLAKVSKKLEEYENEYGEIPTADENVNASSEYKQEKKQDECENFEFYHFDDKNLKCFEEKRTEQEIIKDIGESLYLIYGGLFETVVKGKNFKVQLIQKIELHETFVEAFAKVKVNVYENNILIIEGVNIGFWPMNRNDIIAGDIEISHKGEAKYYKYDNGWADCIWLVIDRMKNQWNSFQEKDILFLPEYEDSTSLEVISEEFKEKTIINIEELLKNNIPTNAGYRYIKAYKRYKNLYEFLEYSGLVYRIESTKIFIMEVYSKRWYLLERISYEEEYKRYKLYLNNIPT